MPSRLCEAQSGIQPLCESTSDTQSHQRASVRCLDMHVSPRGTYVCVKTKGGAVPGSSAVIPSDTARPLRGSYLGLGSGNWFQSNCENRCSVRHRLRFWAGSCSVEKGTMWWKTFSGCIREMIENNYFESGKGHLLKAEGIHVFCFLIFRFSKDWSLSPIVLSRDSSHCHRPILSPTQLYDCHSQSAADLCLVSVAL